MSATNPLADVHRSAGEAAARYDRAQGYPHMLNRHRLAGFADWVAGYEAAWADTAPGVGLSPCARNEFAKGWRTWRNTDPALWARFDIVAPT